MRLSTHVKHILSWVFLVTFILIKVSGLHGITHTNDKDDAKDCVWCHLAGTDQNTPLIAADTIFDFQEILVQETTLVINNYKSISTEKTPFCLIFNKPPPFYKAS
ncbi:hypothetical protein [Mesonia aestuariivivens]|uniref:Uncharacterized protein n=1 Tax=Mesonia aestuariivivens TaxID=2796128 RepID=A0ABS6W174_9FLAO|nr:hypothetical protein [Mesonia aestuariivivens]MBW2961613.1 hypothetical protein [Mesonia aestuariivivens]